MTKLLDDLPGRTPAEQVFNYWRTHQKMPRLCKFTDPRRKLINRALKDYEARDLCALVLYAYTANEPGPKFWRGDNATGRTYLDLTNLLSDAARLPGRVEAAALWFEAEDAAPEVEMDAADPTAILVALSRRAPGERLVATTPEPEDPISRAVKRRKLRPRWE